MSDCKTCSDDCAPTEPTQEQEQELTPEEQAQHDELKRKVLEAIRKRRREENEKEYKEAVRVRDARYDSFYNDALMEGSNKEEAHKEAKELMEELGIYDVPEIEEDDVPEVSERNDEAAS